MPLFQLLALLVISGVILYLVNKYIPMAEPIRIVLNVVVVLVLCYILADSFGLTAYRIPVLRR